MTARLTLSTTLSPSTKLATDQTETVYGTITSLKPRNVKDDQTTKLPSSITSIPNGKTSTFPTVIPSTTGWLKRPRDFIKEISDKTPSTAVPGTTEQTTKHKNIFKQKNTTLPPTTPSPTTTTKHPIDKLIGSDKTRAPSTTEQTTKNWDHLFKEKKTLPATTKPTTWSWQEIRGSTTFPSTTTTKHPTTIIDEQKFTKNASTTLSPTLSTGPPPKKRKIDDEIPLVFIPSRTEDPVSFETKQIFIKETNKFMHQQSMLESKESLDAIRAIHKEKEIRYAMNSIKLRRLQQHPFFRRMLKEVTKEMIYERKDWRKYRSNPRYKDTITSRRRIQPEISDYFLAYAIKFDKRPWLNPGKNRIKTKFYERVDFVDKPFIVTEEKTETKVQHEIVKAKTK